MSSETTQWTRGPYLLSTDKSLLRIKSIHEFLSTKAYWCLGIPLEVVRRSIEHSLCFGLYEKSSSGDVQIGYARIVTDYATFAWLCDVYIEESHRKQGLSKWMMECVMSHPALQKLRRICLATSDAHRLYERYGFEVTSTPENWMEIKDNQIYQKMRA